MNGKQRVLAALGHEQPDRVPTGEAEIDAPIVGALLGRPTLYAGKFELLRAYQAGRRDEVVERIKRDYVEFIREAGHALATVMLVPDRQAEFYPLTRVGQDDYQDGNGNGFRYSHETQELVLIRRSGKPARIISKPPDQVNPTESELEFARYVIEQLGGSHFILATPCMNTLFAPYRGVGFFDAAIEAMIDRPQQFCQDRLKQAARYGPVVARWKSLGCDGIWDAEDVGMNTGTIFSPRSIREVLLPAWKCRAAAVHAADMYYLFHSCGNNRAVWDLFVEAGFDAYQAIQEEEPLADLKRMVGGRLALWGGVSCRLLDIGTPDQIRRQTRAAIESAAPGGGFILGSSHSLGVGVSYENYRAMLDALDQYG